MGRLILTLAAALLTACGGGDWEDGEKGLQPVDCKAKPEVCT